MLEFVEVQEEELTKSNTYQQNKEKLFEFEIFC
jgi:hypothetical protein